MSIKSFAITAGLTPGEYTGKNGLYACRRMHPASAAVLDVALPRLRKMTGALPSNEFHATTMLSNVAIPRDEALFHRGSNPVEARILGGNHFGKHLGILIDAPALLVDHKKWISLGAVFTFPTYDPHTTLVEMIETPSPEAARNLVDYINRSGIINVRIHYLAELVQDMTF